ncbi:conserved hypothetical protein [Methanocaldococcus vulcanius M7]|uniref:Chromosome assembly protein n=1 Tax=Methanocaldococcus vulcanius (strain ATCC 700851 / DSM 12094 / M7) TaxID=579137 RepID=C9RGZ9_METVM|nr:hypothetical protein [Methanocaldococcus vulcanius]ACX72851.1 conserved hypothetical protein [Methanocaldococcus vulcanius M7]
MSLWERAKKMFMKNPIEKLSIRDLEGEKIRLKSKLDRLKKEINKIEKKKKQLFQEGIGADKLKKKILAQEIKALEMEMKLKYKNFTTLQKQYTFVNNLLIIKKYEKELKNIGIWNKISNIEPELLELKLSDIILDGKEFDEMVSNLNKVFEMRLDEVEGEEDEAEKKLFEAWGQVESGGVDVDSAVDSLKLDEEEEDEDWLKKMEKE